MLFKPKFCCNCGEKIERLDWGLLTSRRFCEICETVLVIEDWTPAALALIALVIGILGTTALLRWHPPRVIPAVERPAATPEVQKRVGPGSAQAEGRQGREAEAVKSSFVCGAITKKGKACSRRVAKQGEHCWQHRKKGGEADAPLK